MTSKFFNAKTSYSLAILSGILLLLSYPPFNLGAFLGWFAFAPVFIAIYYETKAKRVNRLLYVMTFCIAPLALFFGWFGASFFPLIVSWLPGVLFGIMIFYVIAVEPIGDYIKSKQLPSKTLSYLPLRWQIFTFPVLATATEFVLCNIPGLLKLFGGVVFFSISKTQWLNPPVLQLASITGMYGITFLVWLVNSAIAYGIIHYRETRKVSAQTIMVLLIPVMIFVGGWMSMPEATTGEIQVVIIQAEPEMMKTEYINELYLNLSEKSLKYEPEMIFWTIWEKYDLWEKRYLAGPYVTEECVNFSQENNVYLSNGLGVVGPDGVVGEYTAPYFLIHMFDGFFPFDPDKIYPELHGFETPFGKFGFIACIESAHTVPTKQWIKDDTRFVLAFSGESAFFGTFPGLLAGNSVYRAVEHRIYTASVQGPGAGSVIIDPYGRLVEDIAPEPEIVAGKIFFTDEKTFYTKYGDVFGGIIVGLTIILIIYNFYLKRKSPFKYCKHCGTQIAKDIKICPKCSKKTK